MSELLQYILSQQDQFRRSSTEVSILHYQVANNNRARIPSLFSDFTAQKHSNPDGYHANVNIWEEVLCRAARAGLISGQDGIPRRLSLETGPYLSQKLESSEWGRPLAINAVIEVAGKVLTHLGKYSSQVDRTFTTTMFSREAAAALNVERELADKDLVILLKYLTRDKQVLATDGEVVRVIHPNEVLSPITKEDRTIASLKTLIEDVGKQVHALEAQITSSREKSKKAIESKNKPSALAALRSKKSAETVLSQRMATLFQLEQVLGSIQQASDQVAMVRIMKDSAGVLRGLNAKVGSAEDVENTLDGLKEEIGKVEDIDSVISEAGQAANVANDNEIDEELDALLHQKEAEEEEEAAESTKLKLAELQNANEFEAIGAKQPIPSGDEKPTVPKAIAGSETSKEISASGTVPLERETAQSLKSSRQRDGRREPDQAMLEN
ncbi:MAG: hypothetical protein Q9209_004231 [Squamulea sp. 1 TL-2023]